MKTLNKFLGMAFAVGAMFFWCNPCNGATPPTQDLQYWMSADSSPIPATAPQVYGWFDQSPTGGHHGTASGAPKLAQAQFPNGLHPVIRLDGAASGFNLASPLDLRLQEVSVYVVASVENSQAFKIMVGIFSQDPECCYGWSMGLNDDPGNPGYIKWWTFTDVGHNFLPNYHFENHVPAMLTGTYSLSADNGTKNLYVNGSQVGNVSGLGPIHYSPNVNEQATVGYLGPSGIYGQALAGDIAEILVFSAVDDFQRAAAEAYLNAKYFQTGVPVVDPPTDNLKLWLRADAGVNLQAPQPVLGWVDQAFKANPHDGTPRGAPMLTQAPFPNGAHPVIRFDGGSAFDLANDADFALQDLTIYAVASVDSSLAGRIFIGNYADVYGWCFGISDSTPGLVKWFSANPPNPEWSGDSLEPAGAALGSRVPALLTATHTSDGAKALYVNGVSLGTSMNTPPIPYSGGEQVTVGCLDFGRQWLVGDIAEIIVCNAVDAFQQASVESYLNAKYFQTGVPVVEPDTGPMVAWLKADAGVSLAEAATPVATWLDQSPGGTHDGTARGTPLLASATFPNGAHPVIRFDGATTGFDLGDAAGLKLQNMSIYVVGSVDNSVAARIFLGNYRDTVGWSVGISDSTAGRIKWWTMSDSPSSLEPYNFPNNSPVLITATITNDPGTGLSAKAVYANSVLQPGDPSSGLPPITYGGGEQLTVGVLDFGRQFLKGDIAEIIVFNAVDDFQRALVEDYLNNKYFLTGPVVDPPTDGMALWLKADAGVIAPGTPIGQLADLAPAGTHNGTAVGTPVLTETTFPNGLHPVVHFNGSSGFALEDSAGLYIQNLSIYVVASVNNQLSGRIFLGNYRDVYGWCFGIADGLPGRVKWFTSEVPGWLPNSLEPPAAALADNVPTLITATKASGGNKALYVNGAEAGSVPGVLDIAYSGLEKLTVGYLGNNNVQWLVGDIAEILVYSSVSDEQRTAVEAYLTEKYITIPPVTTGPPVITSQPQSVTCLVGGPASFTLKYDGQAPFGVWAYRGTTEVDVVATSDHTYTLTLPAVQATDQGDYTFVISNSVNKVTSDIANLTVESTWTAAAGFSSTANPAGAWTYGYDLRDAGGLPDIGTFTVFDAFAVPSPVPLWRSSVLGVDPNVTYNNTGFPQSCCAPGATIMWDPGEMSVGPGLDGQVTVVRWTAPLSGPYDIVGMFLDNQLAAAGDDSADVYVYHNTEQLFTGLPGTEVGSGVTNTWTALMLAAGDTLDFIVGAGADRAATGNHTTFAATITLSGIVPQAPAVTGSTYDSENKTLTVNFLGTPGVTYTVQFADSLDEPVQWDPIGTPTAAPDGTFSVTRSTAPPAPVNGFIRSVYP